MMWMISLLGRINPKIAFMAVIIAAVSWNIYGLRTEVAGLRSEVNGLKIVRDSLKGQLVVVEGQVQLAYSSIDVQNEAIELLALDKAKVDESYAEWKEKPAEVKYEVIYKTMPSTVSTEVSPCDRVKEFTKAVSEIKYEDL